MRPKDRRYQQRTDKDKATEVLLYVTAQVPNMYTALKVLYFADREHLRRYGRTIYGERYVAMMHGPVPSLAYDIIKAARSGWPALFGLDWSELFAVDEHHAITPGRVADRDRLSESDIECLDDAIRKYGRLSFAELKEISHRDEAFLSADENDFISMEALAASIPDADGLLDYLTNG